MTRRFIVLTILVASAAVLVQGLVVLAQTKSVPGIYIPKAEWVRLLDTSPLGTNGIAGGRMNTLVASGLSNVTMRRRLNGPNMSSTHSTATDQLDVTEVMLIVEGSGTFVMGGTYVDAKDRTKGIVGGESHPARPGDIFVIPPGSTHGFSKIDGKDITMFEVRFAGDVTKK